MSSDFLSWVASGLIAIVLLSTLWMAWVIHPEKNAPPLLLANAAIATAAAASAPTATINR